MTASMAWTQRCIPVSVSATSSPMSDLMLCYVVTPLFWILRLFTRVYVTTHVIWNDCLFYSFTVWRVTCEP